MCKKKQFKYCPSEIDECIKNLIRIMNDYGIKTKACCCGHGIYPMTIVIDFNGINYEVISNIYLKRKKRFYKRDSDGYYYIPEVSEPRRLKTSSRRINR